MLHRGDGLSASAQRRTAGRTDDILRQSRNDVVFALKTNARIDRRRTYAYFSLPAGMNTHAGKFRGIF